MRQKPWNCRTPQPSAKLDNLLRIHDRNCMPKIFQIIMIGRRARKHLWPNKCLSQLRSSAFKLNRIRASKQSKLENGWATVSRLSIFRTSVSSLKPLQSRFKSSPSKSNAKFSQRRLCQSEIRTYQVNIPVKISPPQSLRNQPVKSGRKLLPILYIACNELS